MQTLVGRLVSSEDAGFLYTFKKVVSLQLKQHRIQYKAIQYTDTDSHKAHVLVSWTEILYKSTLIYRTTLNLKGQRVLNNSG